MINDNEYIKGEKWKNIVGYKGLYKISNLGRVCSIRKFKREGSGLLKVDENWKYKKVTLRKNGMKRCISIHRLVAEAFIQNPENKAEVNHKDGDKFNNHIDNLEWMTKSENTIHAIENNLIIEIAEKTHRKHLYKSPAHSNLEGSQHPSVSQHEVL